MEFTRTKENVIKELIENLIDVCSSNDYYEIFYEGLPGLKNTSDEELISSWCDVYAEDLDTLIMVDVKNVAAELINNLSIEEYEYITDQNRGTFFGFGALHDLIDANALIGNHPVSICNSITKEFNDQLKEIVNRGGYY